MTHYSKLYELIESSVRDESVLDQLNQLIAKIEVDHMDYRTQRGRKAEF